MRSDDTHRGAHTHTHPRTHTRARAETRTHADTHMHIHTNTSLHSCGCMCLCVYVCVCVCRSPPVACGSPSLPQVCSTSCTCQRGARGGTLLYTRTRARAHTHTQIDRHTHTHTHARKLYVKACLSVFILAMMCVSSCMRGAA